MDARYEADTKIANSKRQFEMQKASFDVEVNTQVCQSIAKRFLVIKGKFLWFSY